MAPNTNTNNNNNTMIQPNNINQIKNFNDVGASNMAPVRKS